MKSANRLRKKAWYSFPLRTTDGCTYPFDSGIAQSLQCLPLDTRASRMATSDCPSSVPENHVHIRSPFLSKRRLEACDDAKSGVRYASSAPVRREGRYLPSSTLAAIKVCARSMPVLQIPMALLVISCSLVQNVRLHTAIASGSVSSGFAVDS